MFNRFFGSKPTPAPDVAPRPTPAVTDPTGDTAKKRYQAAALRANASRPNRGAYIPGYNNTDSYPPERGGTGFKGSGQ